MSLKRTSSDLVNLFKLKRNDLGLVYDYSKYVYNSNDSKSIFVCKEHGEFEQSTKQHIRNGECPVCKKQNHFFKSLSLRLDKGQVYDYSGVLYKNNSTKVSIICSIHGEFYQSPNNHVSKNQDCPRCEKQKRINTCLEKYGVAHPMKSDQVKKKLKQVFINNYGVDNPSSVPEIRQKISIANSTIPENDKIAFKQYVYKVIYYTNKVKHMVPLINKVGVNEYHLDHMYSKAQGFLDGIPPQIIGSLANLKVISSSENISKGRKCAISLEQLISNYINQQVKL